MSEPLAYFLTWRTYGTWLPGDDRGWARRGEGHAAAPMHSRDDAREQAASRLLKHAPITLTEAQRASVMETIRQVCSHRHWALHEVNCRTNHVHVVLTAPHLLPELVMNQLKAWCSRRLNELAQTRDTTWWSRNGSTLYLNSEDAVREKVDYVLNQQ